MTHKKRVLQLLSDHRPHSHHELYALGCVAHSRISDLRRDGHRIEAWKENGLYWYRLVSSAGVLDGAAGSPPGMDGLGDPSSLAAPSSASASNPRSPLEDETHAQEAPGAGDGADALTLFDVVAA